MISIHYIPFSTTMSMVCVPNYLSYQTNELSSSMNFDFKSLPPKYVVYKSLMLSKTVETNHVKWWSHISLCKHFEATFS
jgi:hypothetical protein